MAVPIADLKRLVTDAGQLALTYYGKVVGSVKADQSMFSEADAAVEDFLRRSLTDLAPDYGYIGEETAESKPAAAAETRAWVVDAIDGSRAFIAGMPLWMPCVAVLNGSRAVAGVAVNPVTGEMFWADEDGPAMYGDAPMRPERSAELKPNTFIFGPTNHFRTFTVDWPGRIYCLGAPIYQLCMLAKGAVAGMFFDPAINLWDLALPTTLLERTGAVLVYASGRPVQLAELIGRDVIPEPIYAGSPEMVEVMRERIKVRG